MRTSLPFRLLYVLHFLILLSQISDYVIILFQLSNMIYQFTRVRIIYCASVSHSVLCAPMVCSPPGSSVHGVLQARISGLPFPSSGDLPNPGIKPRSPTLQADAFLSEPPLQGSLQIQHMVGVLCWFLIFMIKNAAYIHLQMVNQRQRYREFSPYVGPPPHTPV